MRHYLELLHHIVNMSLAYTIEAVQVLPWIGPKHLNLLFYVMLIIAPLMKQVFIRITKTPKW